MTKRTKSHYDITVSCGVPYSDDFPASLHEANASAVITQAINVGHRPTGDVRFVGAEPNPVSDQSTLLHYSVPVEARTGFVETPADEGQEETVVETEDE